MNRDYIQVLYDQIKAEAGAKQIIVLAFNNLGESPLFKIITNLNKATAAKALEKAAVSLQASINAEN